MNQAKLLFLYSIGNKHSKEKDFIKHKAKTERIESDFDCSQCSKTFSSLKKKENHIKNVHDKRAKIAPTKSPRKEKNPTENDSKEFIKKQEQIETDSDDDIIELVSPTYS